MRLDKAENTLVVGQDKHLFHEKLQARNLSFVSGEKPEKSLKIEAKIRARFPQQKGTVSIQKNEATVDFDRPQRAITPGQSVVFYEEEKVLGGGVIL